MDAGGTIQYVNPAVERMFGVDSTAREGHRIEDYIHPNDRQQVLERLGDFVSQDSESTERVEFRYEDPDGSYRWLESIGVDKTDTEIDGYIVYSRDITERKEREQQLRREKERLGEFASVVSHDLRNPLNVAQGRIDLAREECDSEHLDDAANGIERSLDLVEDMLTLARAGDQVSEMEPVEISSLVQTCTEHVETADATIVADIDSIIQADRSRLRQLLENLIRNAVEHGGDDVTVTIGDLADGFYVADDGPGIPEDEREKVFKPGHSADEEGTGFGLSIVQEIAEAHDWEVALPTSSEGGARFEFTDISEAAE